LDGLMDQSLHIPKLFFSNILYVWRCTMLIYWPKWIQSIVRQIYEYERMIRSAFSDPTKLFQNFFGIDIILYWALYRIKLFLRIILRKSIKCTKNFAVTQTKHTSVSFTKVFCTYSQNAEHQTFFRTIFSAENSSKKDL